MQKSRVYLLISAIVLLGLACSILSSPPTALPTMTAIPEASPTPLPPKPVEPGETNPDEPVIIVGEIPYTSPFFLNTAAQPFVLLEDQAGFVQRDHDFIFRLEAQVIGPVEIHEGALTYSLALPSIPQGTQIDVDHDGQEESGVQIFAIAYWSNIWGDPFLEERDGTGWSTAYVSTITDSEREDEIIGGILLVWAPDDRQEFPSGFGEDGKLFTDDDPTAPIAAGYSLVNLDNDPFLVYKEARANITLNEGEVAVNDFSELSYTDAFKALLEKASQEYPFTEEKNINWQALEAQFTPIIAQARTDADFYRALRDFAYSIPDGHVNVSLDNRVFYEERGGGLGLVLSQLSDGRVIVTDVLPDSPGERAGIRIGAEIITWKGQPVSEAINRVVPYFGPYSTEHTKHLEQVNFLTRMAPDARISLEFSNPGETQIEMVTLTAVVEYDSLFKTIPSLNENALALPIEGYVLEDSGLGYIRVSTFLDDYNLLARLWERYISSLIDEEVPGLIIDLRANGGGAFNLALDFAGYFFDKEITLYQSQYYSENLGAFEDTGSPIKLKPGPLLYDGPIAILVSPNCVSACEGFAYALSQGDRALVVGNFPTAGAFGEVGRGQYKLPGGISMQLPTGRPLGLDGSVLIEGAGVPLDIQVPVTEESALGKNDTVLEKAIQALLDLIR